MCFFPDSRYSVVQQRGRQLRNELQTKRTIVRRRRRKRPKHQLDSASDLPELMHHRRTLLSIRRAVMSNALRLMDIRRAASALKARKTHGKPSRLPAEWYMGRHRRARRRDLLEGDESHGACLPLSHPPQDPLLHGQLDHTHCAH